MGVRWFCMHAVFEKAIHTSNDAQPQFEKTEYASNCAYVYFCS